MKGLQNNEILNTKRKRCRLKPAQKINISYALMYTVQRDPQQNGNFQVLFQM